MTLGYTAPLNSYTLELNGSALVVGTDLQITPAVNSQAGTAFITTPFPVDPNTSFSSYFQFFIGRGTTPGADGLTFILQNDLDGIDALGAAGGALGYEGYDGVPGISNSLAIEFDTWLGGGSNEPNDNHIGINTNGSVSSLETSTSIPNLISGSSLFAWIDYDGIANLLEIFVNDVGTKPAVPNLSYTIDLYSLTSDQAYIGFSAATGGFNNEHLIEDWELDVYQSSTSIPTLNEWGMIIFSLLLGSVTIWYMRKKVHGDSMA